MTSPRAASERTAEVAAMVLLAVALLCGGGPRGLGDALVHLAAVPCVVLALLRWRQALATRAQRVLAGIVAAAIVLAALQLLPLPPELWSALPGRAALAADLQAAGLQPQWHPLTLDSWGTVRALVALIVFAAMLLLSASLGSAARVRLLKLALAIAVAQALLGFAQAAAGTHAPLRFFDYHHPVGAIGTFANRNHFAILMAMLAPLALAFAVSSSASSPASGLSPSPATRERAGVRAGHERYLPPIAWYATALLLLLASALSYSRAGFGLTLLVTFGAAAVLLWSHHRATANSGKVGPARRNRRAWLLPTAFVGLIAVAIATYAWDGLMQRLAQDPLEDLRWQYLHYGLKAVREHLPLGSGLNTFRWVYAAAEPVPAMVQVFADRAHNDLLQTTIEAGLPGLLLVLGFVTVVVTFCLRSFPMGRVGAFTDHAHANVIRVALWAPLAHSLVDYPLRTHAVALVLAVMLSVLSGRARD